MFAFHEQLVERDVLPSLAVILLTEQNYMDTVNMCMKPKSANASSKKVKQLADFSCFFLRRCCFSAPCEVCVNGGVHVSTCRGGERWKVAGKSSLSTGAVLETSGWTHDAVLANLLRQQKALQELRGWRQEKRKKRRKEKLTEWNHGHVTLYTSTICWHGEHQTLCRSFLFVLTLLN